MKDADGWTYTYPPAEGDSRKLVTLEEDGMVWVGIRAFSATHQRWLNGGEPERATISAWMDLPAPAKGFWSGKSLLGTLVVEPPEGQP